jgi:Tfp pilus assembly protein PilW
LIELLVAMTILVIITLMVARIFQQAGVAWDTGARKAEQMMSGRAVSDFLAQQFSHAVPDPNGGTFNVSGLPATFLALEDASPGIPAIRSVAFTNVEDLADGIIDVKIETYGDISQGLPVYGIVSVTMSNNVEFQTGFYFSNRDRNRL